MEKEHLDNLYTHGTTGEREVFKMGLPIMLLQKHLLQQGSILLEEHFNLSHSEADVLISLHFNNRIMTPTALYEATIFSSGGMTKLLKKLENRDLIIRIPSIKDKRSMLVQLTDKGEEIVLKSLKLLVEKDNELFGILDKEEREVLMEILKKLVYSLF